MRSIVPALRSLASRAAAVCAAVLMAATAMGQVYTNPTQVFLNAPSSLYPTQIAVAGGPTSIIGVKVTLNNLSLPACFDFSTLRALLVSPGGQKIMLIGTDLFGDGVSGANVIFASNATAVLPANTIASGTYAPSADTSYTTFNMLAPAPANPYVASFGSVIGTNSNGTWKLYVQSDDIFNSGCNGTLGGGWTIEFGGSPSTTSMATAFTYQGRLTGGAANGTIDTRFTLWDHLTSTSEFNRVAGPVTVNAVPLASGLFTASVDFGKPVPADRKTWLQIEVANPAGGAFVSLSPRQAMTSAPLANLSSLASGTLVGFTTPVGVAQQDLSRVGTHVDFGTHDSCGDPDNFNGMRVIINPGTNNCGVSEDILFSTAECNTSCPREIMRINGRGNVGIGTTTPSQKLHVIGNILASGTITPSCAKLKENIEPMGDALDRLTGLNAVRFDWKADEAKTRGFTHDLGFIAEDVAKVFPEVVFRDDKGEIMGLDYSRMSAVAVGAIKQLKAENDSLKARLEKIEALLADQAAKDSAK